MARKTKIVRSPSPWQFETDEEKRCYRKFVEIARKRTSSIIVQWASFDQPLSLLAISCYAQAYEDLVMAQINVEQRQTDATIFKPTAYREGAD